VIPRYFVAAEAEHELQNPTSEEKLLLLGKRLGLDYEDRTDTWTTFEGTVVIFETSGLPVVSVIASSEDDWDRYETLHWRTVERWLAAHAHDPAAPEIRSRHECHKHTYLRYGRELLGWAMLVGCKRP